MIVVDLMPSATWITIFMNDSSVQICICNAAPLSHDIDIDINLKRISWWWMASHSPKGRSVAKDYHENDQHLDCIDFYNRQSLCMFSGKICMHIIDGACCAMMIVVAEFCSKFGQFILPFGLILYSTLLFIYSTYLFNCKHWRATHSRGLCLLTFAFLRLLVHLEECHSTRSKKPLIMRLMWRRLTFFGTFGNVASVLDASIISAPIAMMH